MGCLWELLVDLLFDPIVIWFVVSRILYVPVRALIRPATCPPPIRLQVCLLWTTWIGLVVAAICLREFPRELGVTLASLGSIVAILTATIAPPGEKWTLTPLWG